jgi:hypothetical protein|tara:strand:- start:173 stop:421 length:249 start_codon:yes stop_codon:yes gene_type:complete
MARFDEHTLMLQSYYVITNKVGYEQLLNRDIKVTLIFDPTDEDENRSEVFDELIEYFEGIEEYEKCAELLHSKNLMNDLSEV